MAIYSLNVSSVGRTTHAAGTAGAHLLYIAREGAKPTLIAHDIPTEPQNARTWMDRQEAGDRKNARVADRIRLAIPRELTREQRFALVRDFCERVTGNRVPWFAAIHQDGDDEHNPHAHILVRDRDCETGKRVLKWSDSARDRKAAGLPENAVDMIRALWEERANEALERAGHGIRIDRRSLEDQGVDRHPTIHIGPNAARIEEFVHRPESKVKVDRRGRRDRVIDYPMIDAGRTRKDRHAEIVDLNLERDARSPDFLIRARAQLLREQILLDRNLERRLVTDARRRTLEERRIRGRIREEARRYRESRDDELRKAENLIRSHFIQARDQQRQAHAAARSDMKAQQSTLPRRFLRLIDVTGTVRRRQAEQRRELVKCQIAERRALVATWKAQQAELSAFVQSRCAEALQDLDHRAKLTFGPLRDRNREAERQADLERQKRAAEREAAEKRLEETMRQVRERLQHDQNRKRPRGPRL